MAPTDPKASLATAAAAADAAAATPTTNGTTTNNETSRRSGASIHGADAARRQAITELLFFSAVGDLNRVQRLVKHFTIDIADKKCCDYDFRTPLHLAASEGAHSVVRWLIEDCHAQVNAIDRFKRTPLEDAVRGDHPTMVQLLLSKGGKVWDTDKLVDITSSRLAGSFRLNDVIDDEWEIDPTDLDIQQKLGEGEFGTVHLAYWHGTKVAVKILRKSDEVALGDFKTELNILSKVHHPHTVQFLGACTKQQPYILVTEFMCGGSLADVFRTGRKLSLRRGVEMALDTARGLAYLHYRKPQAVVHRDLKPANLMVSGNPYKAEQRGFRERLQNDTGLVKIADFGLSKSLVLNVKRQKTTFRRSIDLSNYMGGVKGIKSIPEDSSGGAKEANARPAVAPQLNQRFRMTGETGSYRYMAPEVFRHEPYNNKVDVYAFAMIMYQLFEGRAPFSMMDPIEAARLASTEHRRPVFLTGANGEVVPDAMRRLVQECWDPDPDKRPEFGDIVKRLEEFLTGLGPPPVVTYGGGDGGGGASAGGGGGCCSLQ